MNKKERLKKGISSAIDNPVDVIKSNIKRFKGDKTNNWKLDICANCEHRLSDPVFGDYMCGYEDAQNDACYCPLKSLIHSDKGCPKKLW